MMGLTTKKSIRRILLALLLLGGSHAPIRADWLKVVALGSVGALCLYMSWLALSQAGEDGKAREIQRTYGVQNYMASYNEKMAVIKEKWEFFKAAHAKEIASLNRLNLVPKESGLIARYLQDNKTSQDFEKNNPEIYQAWKSFFEEKLKEICACGCKINPSIKIRLLPSDASRSLDDSLSFSAKNIIQIATNECFFRIPSHLSIENLKDDHARALLGFYVKHEWGHAFFMMNNFVEHFDRLKRMPGERLLYVQKLKLNLPTAETYKTLTYLEKFADTFAAKMATDDELYCREIIAESRLKQACIGQTLDPQDIALRDYKKNALENKRADEHPHTYDEYKIIADEIEQRKKEGRFILADKIISRQEGGATLEAQLQAEIKKRKVTRTKKPY